MGYNRILLKLSGESLQGEQKYGLSPAVLQSYAEQIKAAVATGVQIGIVIGGGNIFRGLQGAKKGFDRVKGDQMGKLSCFFDDPADVGNLISGPSAFSKTSLNIWKFTVHILLKPGLENFEHYFTSM